MTVSSSRFAYTSFGALLTEDGPWGNDTITYSYKTNHLRANFNLQQPSATDWTQSYSYDTANRLTGIGFSAGAISYAYDGTRKLRPQKITFPNGGFVDNYYDSPMGRLWKTYLTSATWVNLNGHQYAYNTRQQKTKVTHTMPGVFPGNWVDYTYDALGQLKTATGWESATQSRKHEQLTYSYDAAGNLSSRNNNGLVHTVTPNALNQLYNVTRTASLTLAGRVNPGVTNVLVNGSSSGVEVYQDLMVANPGLSLADGLNTFSAIAEDVYGRKNTNTVSANLPASLNFTYDQNGNLTSDGQRTFTYDHENQLTHVEVANSWRTEFRYDAMGRRRWRKEFSWVSGDWQQFGETRYIYDGRRVIQERDGSNARQVSYTRGLDLSGSLEGAGGIGGLLGLTQHSMSGQTHFYYHADVTANILVGPQQPLDRKSIRTNSCLKKGSWRIFWPHFLSLVNTSNGCRLCPMPRANRYIVAGNIYHLTHRCHDRAFLLKFAKDRNGYRQRLRQAIVQWDLSLLAYNITSNHVHLVVYAEDSEQVAGLMQQAAGEFAREYNRRKDRSGAFWEGRYHATMVDSGEYLWECLKYVELNMVRCGVVKHPREWEWSGYGELMGGRKRNRLLDVQKLLWLVRAGSLDEFQKNFNAALEEAIINDELKRQEKWTTGIAVGSQSFVEAIEQRIGTRQRMDSQQQSGTWVLREEYESLFEGQNASIGQFRV